jgi:hypothetical protein
VASLLVACGGRGAVAGRRASYVAGIASASLLWPVAEAAAPADGDLSRLARDLLDEVRNGGG